MLSRCGIEVRGRATRFRINYRTTEEIRRWSVALLKGEPVDDLDGGEETLYGYQSLFNGPEPCIKHFDTQQEEFGFVLSSLQELLRTQAPDTVCIMARTRRLVEWYAREIEKSGIPVQIAGRSNQDLESGRITLGTMHRLKGLEYPISSWSPPTRMLYPTSGSSLPA